MNARGWKLRFFTVWAGQAFSLVGSALVQFALIWWLTETTGSAKTLALATTASLLPTIVLGPIAGTLVDRWSRKWVLVVSDGLIAALTALLGALFWLDIAQVWHVYAILLLRSAADCFQNPAMVSSTSLMVPQDQLARVTGMNSTLQGVMRFVAPPLGALLLALVNVRGILPLDVATAAVAIFPLFVIHIPQPAAEAAAGAGLRSVAQGFVEGLRYVWDWHGLRFLVATAALWAIVAQPIIAFLPLLVTDHFGGGALELGWLQSAMGIGMIVGGLLLSAWGGFQRRMATSLAGTFGVVLSFLVTSVAPANALWVGIASYALLGVAVAVHSSGLRAAQQAVVAPEMQGRFFAINQSLFSAMGPLALSVAAPLADVFGVRPFWFVATGGALVIALVRRLTPAIYAIEGRLDRKSTAEASIAVP
jgi:DHA3 family macrolide efflux protein-like MFS transporter